MCANWDLRVGKTSSLWINYGWDYLNKPMHYFAGAKRTDIGKFVIENMVSSRETAYLDGCIANMEVYVNDQCDDVFIAAHMKYLSDYFAVYIIVKYIVNEKSTKKFSVFYCDVHPPPTP